MSQLVFVKDGPIAPGVLCSAREEPHALGPAVSGELPLDMDRVSLPAGTCGRIRIVFSEPVRAPLVVSFWATLSEQPFPRRYQTTVVAGTTELVWPRSRQAITALQRIQTQEAPGGSVSAEFLKWSAVPSRDADPLLCGLYPANMTGPAIPGRMAPLQLRGAASAVAIGSIRADDALVSAGAYAVRVRTASDVHADHVGTALEDAAAGSNVRLRLDIQPGS